MKSDGKPVPVNHRSSQVPSVRCVAARYAAPRSTAGCPGSAASSYHMLLSTNRSDYPGFCLGSSCWNGRGTLWAR